MSAAQSTNPRGRYFERTLSAVTQPSLLRYPPRSEDYRRHVADFERTRTAPGADPRGQWDDGEHPRNTRGLSADEDDAGYSPNQAEAYRRARLRYPRNERRSLFEQNDGPNGGLSWASETYADGCPGLLRYVPRDVVRWRTAEHRAELTRRAREYSALQPHGWRR